MSEAAKIEPFGHHLRYEARFERKRAAYSGRMRPVFCPTRMRVSMTDQVHMTRERLEQAFRDPAAVFAGPEEVVDHPDLTLDQKIQILSAWEYDAAEVAVAEEEGMPGPDDDLLRRILLALDTLVQDFERQPVAPTKQHGLLGTALKRG
jgi:hypothetical protein